MKTNLQDVTFLLLVHVDTIERVENLLVVVEYLVSNFDTKVEILEVASYNNGIVKKILNKKVNYTFLEDDDPILFRTKYLNRMLSSVSTTFVAVWDVDVLLETGQVIEAMNLLRSGRADFVIPYEKKALDTSLILRKLFLRKKKLDFLSKHADKMKEMYPPNPLGGAFFCKLDSYIKIGLENEDFYGWGVEDGERYLRWKNSEFKVERVKGALFHLSHPRGINSIFHAQDQSFIKERLLESCFKQISFLSLKKRASIFAIFCFLSTTTNWNRK